MSGKETRQRILDTAFELISEKGYARASVSDICKMVGITKPSLYYYFDSKDEILLTLLDSLYINKGDILSRMPEKMTKAAFTQGLLLIGDDIIKSFEGDDVNRKFLAEVDVLRTRMPALSEYHQETFDMILDDFETYLNAGDKAGLMKKGFDAKLHAQELYVVMTGLSHASLNEEDVDLKGVWASTVNNMVGTWQK